MAVQKTELHEADTKGRITLLKGFANSTLLLELVSDVEIIIRKAKVIPLQSGEDPFPKSITLSNRDFDAVMATVENPPKPNRQLKKLMSHRAGKKMFKVDRTTLADRSAFSSGDPSTRDPREFGHEIKTTAHVPLSVFSGFRSRIRRKSSVTVLRLWAQTCMAE